MAFNGSGSFIRTNGVNSGSDTWDQDRNAGTKILSSRHDAHDQDLANGLSNCITKDGQTTVTANIPFAGFELVNIGSATARANAARLSQVQDGSVIWGGTSTNSGNAYSITLSPPITAYAAGQRFVFKANAANTGAATLNVNAVGAVNIRQGNNVALEGNEILANQIVEVVYDGAQFIYVNQPFFAYRTWTTTLSGSGSMTLSGTTINANEYFRIGHFIFFVVNASYTVGGTPSTDIQFTPPTSADSGAVVGIGCAILDNGTWFSGTCRSADGSTFNVRRYDSATLTAGSGQIIVSGMYVDLIP